MKRRIAVVTLTLVLSSGLAAPTEARLDGSHREGTEAKLKQLEERFEVLRKERMIPGMAVAVVSSQQVVLAKGFGFMDGEGQRPVTPHTSFCIASITKPITAAVLMRLAEVGKLDLGFKMSDAPGYAAWCERFSRSSSIFAKDLDCQAAITVKDVLSHTVNGRPGEKFSYNAAVYSQLRRVVPVVSKMTLAELLYEYVLGPARMTETAAGWYDPKKSHVLTNLAQPRRVADDGDSEISITPIWDVGTSSGIISTVLDLAKFDIAMDRNVIVPEKIKQQMWSPTMSPGGQPQDYGIGWYVQSYKGTKLVWHSGWEPNSYSGLFLKIPEKGLTLIALANSEGVWWRNRLDGAEVEKSAFAAAFLELFL
ncbi:MAG: serine hydrolase domain-containing protein [Candidatus Polarisedimenticolia bacterium]